MVAVMNSRPEFGGGEALTYSTDGIDDIVKEFIVESTENLDQLDRDLISLKKTPPQKSFLGPFFAPFTR